MSEEDRKPEFKIESQGFDEANRDLHECMQCGATISASSAFCRVCGAELSGGGWEHPAVGDEAAERD
jgi:ribosomal protein L37AE/L43A